MTLVISNYEKQNRAVLTFCDTHTYILHLTAFVSDLQLQLFHLKPLKWSRFRAATSMYWTALYKHLPAMDGRLQAAQ